MDHPTALITGGAKGIGRAISERLAADGWNLVLWARDRAALERAADEIRRAHRVSVETEAVDLSAPGDIAARFERGLPKALVCNAGDYGTLGNLADVDLDAWKKSFDLNFFSVARLMQAYLRAALKHPAEFHRKLVVMSGSGLGGSQVHPGISAYACAKAALYRLVEVAHEEVAGARIDVNCIAPGFVKTGITAQAVKAGKGALGDLYESSLKVLNKGGTPPELAAEAVSRLLSEACDGLSGRLISAKWDGKFLADRERAQAVVADRDMLRLRRIDNELFRRV